jgi:hypothetical protein
MIKQTSSLFLCFFLCSIGAVNAQDSTTVQDFEMWTGISVKKSFLEKKLDFSLCQEFRFDENALHVDKYFTQFGGSFKLIDDLKLSLAYRFYRNNRNSGYRNEKRLITDLSYKHKVDRFQFQYRLRYQRHDILGESKDEGDYATSKFRLRLKSTYNIKGWKLDPYFTIEGFYTLETINYDFVDGGGDPESFSGIQKLRYTIGTSYKINKLMTVGAFYRVEQELKSYPTNYNTSRLYYIGGLNLTFKL